jgi:hypothetical protein
MNRRSAAAIILGLFVCDGSCAGARGQSLPGGMRLGDVIFEVGALEGSREETFGAITDLAFAPDGRLAVLDGVDPSLKVYSKTGGLEVMLGSEGDGPGEWSWPSSVDWRGGDTVVVLSQGHFRLHIYEATAPGSLVGEVTLPFLARDFCLLGRRIFLLGMKDGRTVHEIAWDGKLVRSFAPPDSRRKELAAADEDPTQEWSVDGRLLCDEARGLVIEVPLILPSVTAHTADGRESWSTELSDYRRTRYVRVPERPGSWRLTPDPKTGTAHELHTTSVLPNGDLLIQLLENSLRSDRSTLPTDTRLISMQGGREDVLPRGLPRIGAIGPDRIAILDGELAPRVVVYRTGGG